MATKYDIELYLDAFNFPFEEVNDELWRVESPEDRVDNIMVQSFDNCGDDLTQIWSF